MKLDFDMFDGEKNTKLYIKEIYAFSYQLEQEDILKKLGLIEALDYKQQFSMGKFNQDLEMTKKEVRIMENSVIFNWEDFEKSNFDTWTAYEQSKTNFWRDSDFFLYFKIDKNGDKDM